MSSLMFLPLMFLMNKFDYKDEQTLLITRVGFYASLTICTLVNLYIKKQVEQTSDDTPIWVPKPGGFGQPSGQYTKTTRSKHAQEVASQGLNQNLMVAGLMSLFSFQFGMHVPLAIQALLIPINLATSPLFKMYVLGQKIDKPWNEKLSEPAPGEGDASGDAAEKDAAGSSGKATTEGFDSSASEELLDVIIDSWDTKTPFTMDLVAPLLENKADINVRTPEGWSALMVACGQKATTTDTIRSLIAHGADVTLADDDGWNALHWACQNGGAAAATVLLSDMTSSEKAKVLRAKDVNGKTADVVAKEAGHTELSQTVAKAASELVVEEAEQAETSAAVSAAAAPATPASSVETKEDNVEDID